jgi:hypothetical protein
VTQPRLLNRGTASLFRALPPECPVHHDHFPAHYGPFSRINVIEISISSDCRAKLYNEISSPRITIKTSLTRETLASLPSSAAQPPVCQTVTVNAALAKSSRFVPRISAHFRAIGKFGTLRLTATYVVSESYNFFASTAQTRGIDGIFGFVSSAR